MQTRTMVKTTSAEITYEKEMESKIYKRFQFLSPFKNKTLALENPSPKQNEAIKLLTLLEEDEQNDPLRPNSGLYIYGPSGTGKTHLISVYANTLGEILMREEKLRKDFWELAWNNFYPKEKFHSSEIPNLKERYLRLDDEINDLKEQIDSENLEKIAKQSLEEECDKKSNEYWEIIHKIDNLRKESKKKYMSYRESKLDTLFAELENRFPHSLGHLSYVDFSRMIAEEVGDTRTSSYHLDEIARRIRETRYKQLAAKPILMLDQVDRRFAASFSLELLAERRIRGLPTFVTSCWSPKQLASKRGYNSQQQDLIAKKINEMMQVISFDDVSA